MDRRNYLKTVSGSLITTGAIIGTVSGSGSLEEVTSVKSSGADPDERGAVRFDVVGAKQASDHEVRESVKWMDSAYSQAVSSSTGIEGYELRGWNSDVEFSGDACYDEDGDGSWGGKDISQARSEARSQLEGTRLEGVDSAITWIWYCGASATRGDKWGNGQLHSFAAKYNNDLDGIKVSVIHETTHALISEDDVSADDEHDLGTVKFRGHPYYDSRSNPDNWYRTPMTHRGAAYKNEPCSKDIDGVPTDQFTPTFSECTLDAIETTWKTLL